MLLGLATGNALGVISHPLNASGGPNLEEVEPWKQQEVVSQGFGRATWAYSSLKMETSESGQRSRQSATAGMRGKWWAPHGHWEDQAQHYRWNISTETPAVWERLETSKQGQIHKISIERSPLWPNFAHCLVWSGNTGKSVVYRNHIGHGGGS